MRRTVGLATVVASVAVLLAIPGPALARADFTEYTGTETHIGGPVFGPADWTKPVYQPTCVGVGIGRA